MPSRVSKITQKWKYKIQAGVVVECAICNEPISLGGDKGKGHLTADHIVPKALGGTDAKDNLQPAHRWCNNKRGHMLIEEFADRSSKEAIVKRAVEIIEEKNRQKESIPDKLKRLWGIYG